MRFKITIDNIHDFGIPKYHTIIIRWSIKPKNDQYLGGSQI